MWTYEHSIDSQADADTLFALFSDVGTWPDWNAGVERMDLNGPFRAGTAGTMVVPEQGPLPFELTWVERGRGFEDATEIPGAEAVVRVRHILEPLSHGGTRITYRCVIDGPAADEVGPGLGPMITGDFPEVMAALSARAGATTRER